MLLTPPILHRLRVARHLFQLAAENANARRSVSSLAAINLLQDAIETFLLAAAEHLQAPVSEKMSFAELMAAVDKKLEHPLSFRSRLSAINRMRVASKHGTITPDQAELDRAITVTREYLGESSERVFGRTLFAIGVADEIERKDVRQLIEEAEAAFRTDDYQTSITAIRKAFFITFEALADINPAHSDRRGIANERMWLGVAHPLGLTAEAIREHVKEPFDYIYFDENKLARDLRRDGIDETVFETVRALTPAVYIMSRKWLVREDSALFDSDIAERAFYALEAVPNLVIKRQQRMAKARPYPFGYGEWMEAKTMEVRYYRSASRAEPIGDVSALGPFFQASARVPALDSEENFYETMRRDDYVYVYVAEADAQPAPSPNDMGDEFEPDDDPPDQS